MVHHNPRCIMKQIGRFLPPRLTQLVPPRCTSGPSSRRRPLRMVQLSPSKYVQQSVKNVETFLKNYWDGRYSLPKGADNPFPCDYAPNKDVSLQLQTYVAKFHVQLIGILRWMCELGRIDICTEVSMLFSYSMILVRDTWTQHYMCSPS